MADTNIEETDVPPPHAPAPPFSRRSFLRGSMLAAAGAAGGPVLLSACGGDDGGVGGGSSLEEATFLSPIPLETLSLTGELLADAGGHFEKHGLDLTLRPAKGSAQATQTLLSGIAPITRIGLIEHIKAVTEKDQPLVAVGMPVRRSLLRFVYDRNGHRLTKPEDLAGQTIGVPSEGGTSDNVISLVLASAGLDPGEAKRQVVGLSTGTFDLVKQGRIGAYVVSLDTAGILASKDPAAGVFDPSPYVKSDLQIYATTRDALTREAGVLRAFLAGVNDAMASMLADRSLDATLGRLRGKYTFATLGDDAIAKSTLTTMRDVWTGGDARRAVLVNDEETWRAGYAELRDANLVEAGGNPALWFDNSLLSGPTTAS